MNKPDKDYNYKKTNRYSLIQSFSFAFRGIGFALFWERNFRIHLTLATYFIYLALKYYSFSKAEFAVLILAMAIVMTCELFNTAIEKAVDLVTPEYSLLAKISKDVAAGAVLVSAIGSAVMGAVLFWNPDTISLILHDMLTHFYIWIPLIVISLLLIFLPEKNIKENNEDNNDNK